MQKDKNLKKKQNQFWKRIKKYKKMKNKFDIKNKII